MKALKRINNIQILKQRVTALGRFIQYSAKRCLPFFKTLKGKNKFVWGKECIETFHNLKHFLLSPSLLSSLVEGEILVVYLSIKQETMSSMFVWEDKGEQSPAFYASQVLKGEKLNYPPLEKLAFAVLMAATKLWPYFESHTIEVRKNYPLQKVLRMLELLGRLSTWAIILSAYESGTFLEIQWKPIIWSTL